MLSEKCKQDILKMQVGELTEYYIYTAIAKGMKDDKNAEIITKYLHSPFGFSDMSPCHALSCQSLLDQDGTDFGMPLFFY